jgi:hypothetical protein
MRRSSWPERERLPGRDPELKLDEVEPGDGLRDRVLDLEPRVHLHEEEAVRPQPLAGVRDELDRARPDIADRARRLDGRPAHDLPHLGGESGGRRLLDHLLVAALQRAIALEQVDDVAVPVREDLHLDVPGREHVLLDEHARVAERRLGFALRRSEPPRTRAACRRGACPCRRRPAPP